jgi:putative oxidoreductase
MSIGMLIIRIVVGLLFVGHGTQKLFGWFGGHGRSGTTGFMESLGYPAPGAAAVVGGAAEAVGGVLLLLGFLTPLGSLLVIAMMVSAMLAVHVSRGMWNTTGGIELPLVYAVVAAGIAFGPGRFSLDRVIGWGWNQRVAAIAAIALGVVAGVVAQMLRRTAEPAESSATETSSERRAA